MKKETKKMKHAQISKVNWQDLDIPSLVGATALRLEMIADHLLFKPLNLTAASFRILAVIDRCGTMTPTDLIESLGGTKSNITQRLAFLNRSGLVKTARLKGGDGRKVLVSLTESGRRQVLTVRAIFQEHNVHVEKFFKPAEIKSFVHFIIKLNQGLDACDQETFKFKYKPLI